MKLSWKSMKSAGLAGMLALAAPGAPEPPRPAPTFTAQEVGVDERLGQSVPLDLVLKDEDGRPVALRSLLGRPTLLTLNYFRCSGICTPQLNGVAELLGRTGLRPGEEFQVVTVSFDDRDTPEIAAEKRSNYLGSVTRPTPAAAWRFLTGDAAATKALADSVGFKFKRVGDDFIHAGAAMVLSPQGKITRYLYGITYLPADVDMAMQEAARGEAQPSINKLLKFCFTYDPNGRRLVLNFTQVAAGVVLLLAVGFVLALALRPGRKRKGEAGK